MPDLRVVPSAPAVTQEELDMIIALNCQIAALQSLRAEECRRVLGRLIGGASIEPGRHTADLAEEDRGPGRLIRLMIDGKKVR